MARVSGETLIIVCLSIPILFLWGLMIGHFRRLKKQQRNREAWHRIQQNAMELEEELDPDTVELRRLIKREMEEL